jgi:hypothetical protein
MLPCETLGSRTISITIPRARKLSLPRIGCFVVRVETDGMAFEAHMAHSKRRHSLGYRDIDRELSIHSHRSMFSDRLLKREASFGVSGCNILGLNCRAVQTRCAWARNVQRLTVFGHKIPHPRYGTPLKIGPRRAHALISERLAMLYSYEICASFAEEGSCVAGQLPQMRLHHVCATVEALRCKDAASKLRIELLKCGERHFQIVPNWKGDYHHRARDNAGLV